MNSLTNYLACITRDLIYGQKIQPIKSEYKKIRHSSHLSANYANSSKSTQKHNNRSVNQALSNKLQNDLPLYYTKKRKTNVRAMQETAIKLYIANILLHHNSHFYFIYALKRQFFSSRKENALKPTSAAFTPSFFLKRKVS